MAEATGRSELSGPSWDLSGALRALRQRADLSQRELAARSGVPPATLARIESGAVADPRLLTVERLARGAGARLAVVDIDGSEPVRLAIDGWCDQADRRYPPHLDPAYETRWRRGSTETVVSFTRNRRRRDLIRRERADEERCYLFTEVRRLGPGDGPVLAALIAKAASFDLAGDQHATGPGPLTDEEQLRYLRDPSLRHWVAEDHGQLVGHLGARLLVRLTGSVALVVTEIGVSPQHRSGMAGPLLAAALCDEAARLAVTEILAIAPHTAAAAYLRTLGFNRRRPRLPLLLRLGE